MTYLDLIRNADYKLDNDAITLGEYEKMIEPLNREIQPEHKQGEWIPVTHGMAGYECDQCHEYAPYYANGNEYLSKFCPSCGSLMTFHSFWRSDGKLG